MNPKLKKTLLVTTGIIALLVVIIIAFLSPIAKYLIEKYDVEYTGREIEMDILYVNPFTGNVYFRNLAVYENKSDSVFFSTTGLTVNLEMLKLISGTYEISELTLTEPKAVVIQNDKYFNFNDLVERFASDTTQIDTTNKEPVKFNILDVSIIDGKFRYDEAVTPVNYSVEKFNFESPGKYWDQDTITGKLSLEAGEGRGKLSSEFGINVENMNYGLSLLIEKFDVILIQQYLAELSSFGELKALVDVNMSAKGNINEATDIDAKGKIVVNDFHLAKTPGDDYASFHKFGVGIVRLNPKNNIYSFDTISLEKPFFKFEQYDSLSNIEAMFSEGVEKTPEGEVVLKNPEKFNLILELANYVKLLSTNFFQSDYKLNKIAITDGEFIFNDYSLNEKFFIGLKPFSFVADSIDKQNRRVNAVFKADLQPYGNTKLVINMNPKDEEDFNLNFNLQNIPAPLFNPYTVTFTSYPLDRGIIEVNANWNVLNGKIKSKNNLLIVDPRVAKNDDSEKTKWVPMPLIMSFVRERGNVIDYSLPITGDLKNPDFNIGDILIDLLKNILTKPPTTPYQYDVKEVEREIEESLTLTWRMNSVEMSQVQKKYVADIAKFLKDNPEANITISSINYKIKEEEHKLMYEAKKKFYLAKNNKKLSDYTKEDSVAVEKISPKDAAFVKYLDKQVNNPLIFTVQGKASKIVDLNVLDRKLKVIQDQRKNNFLNVFKENGTDQRVKFEATKEEIPFNGFSYFRISYNGDVPESLKKAFDELRKKNNAKPRREYKDERRNLFQKIFKK